MKRWLIFLWAIIVLLPSAQAAMPPRPTTRILDDDTIFDPKTKEYLSQTLKSEFAKNRISIYIVALSSVKKGQETATANMLRDAWIKDPVGVVVLFTRSTDKISVSLTDSAYRLVALGGRLEDLASKIDEYNEDGPSRGMPKILSLLLDRMRVDRKVVIIQESEWPTALIMGPILILLALLGWWLFKLYRYMEKQNVFTPSYTLKCEPVKPVLGSTIGGINTAEVKF